MKLHQEQLSGSLHLPPYKTVFPTPLVQNDTLIILEMPLVLIVTKHTLGQCSDLAIKGSLMTTEDYPHSGGTLPLPFLTTWICTNPQHTAFKTHSSLGKK